MKYLLAVSFAFGVAFSGRADSITCSTGLNTVTQSGMVSLFDPGMGTLQEVSFAASGTIDQTVIFRGPISAGSYRQFVGINFIPRVIGVGSLGMGGQIRTVDFLNSPSISTFDIGTSFAINLDLTSDLDVFEGRGMANVQMFAMLAILSPSLHHDAYPTYGSGNAVITYTYGTVSEPAGMITIVIGMTILMGWKLWKETHRELRMR